MCMFKTTQLITFIRLQPFSKFPFASSMNLNVGALLREMHVIFTVMRLLEVCGYKMNGADFLFMFDS